MTMLPLSRRGLSALSMAILGLAVLPPGQAQSYPDRPVRILHGFAAGGNADAVARILATSLTLQLGQPYFVEAKPGAGGTLANDTVAKAKPDGYTLLLATGGYAIAAAMHHRLPYDTVKSFQPISAITSFPFLIVVNSASPYRNLQELLAAARIKPTPLTFGSAGVGTGQHMTGALLSHKAGIASTHVPYRGDAGSVTAALSGEVDFVVAPATAVIQHLRAGTLRAVAISGRTRWDGLPQVATVAEQGIADFDVRSWTALLAPSGTPPQTLERLHLAVRTALEDAGARQRLEEVTGGGVKSSTPQELGSTIQSDIHRWADLVRDTRMQRD